MTTPRPALRAIAVALALLILLVTPVAAETLYDDRLTSVIVTSDTGYCHYVPVEGQTPSVSEVPFSRMILDARGKSSLNYVSLRFHGAAGNNLPLYGDGTNATINYRIGKTGGSTWSPWMNATLYVKHHKDFFGNVKAVDLDFVFPTWAQDAYPLIGPDWAQTTFNFKSVGSSQDWGYSFYGNFGSPVVYRGYASGSKLTNIGSPALDVFCAPEAANVDFVVASYQDWKNSIRIERTPGQLLSINLTRYNTSNSTLIIYDRENSPTYTNVGYDNLELLEPYNEVSKIVIRDPAGGEYEYEINTASSSTPVLVHIIALDARNENLLLDAAVEVRDQTGALVATGSTSPNGWYPFSYDLPANLTDEDFQRYYAVNITLPGWTQKVQAMKFYPAFIPRSGDWIRVEMLPDSGGPADPGNTYLMFYVRDLAGNGLPDAFVELNGEFWKTNNAGHVAVEVPKNATYPYVVRKTGYMTISGSATVEGENSYTVNVCLGKGAVPTNPPATSGPGDTPGPGPTPDRRTNEEKGQAVIDMIADNAEGLGALALICLLVGLLKLMVKW